MTDKTPEQLKAEFDAAAGAYDAAANAADDLGDFPAALTAHFAAYDAYAAYLAHLEAQENSND